MAFDDLFQHIKSPGSQDDSQYVWAIYFKSGNTMYTFPNISSKYVRNYFHVTNSVAYLAM